MPYDARATGDLLRPFHVFLSSPGDVKAERRIAEEVLGEDQLLRERIAFRVVSWDDPNAPCPTPADLNPQQAIDLYRRRPADCDVVVVILWSRLGAHLDVSAHRKPDGGRYLSGTEWEYEDARAGRRRIFLYHRTEKRLLDDEDPAFEENRRQKRLVGEFLQRFRNPDGSFNGGVTPYPDVAAFGERLDSDLREELARRFGGIDPGVRDRLETLERIAEDERAARQEALRQLDARDETIRGLNAAIAALGAQARAEPEKPGVEHALARLAAGAAAEAIAIFDDVLQRKQREGEAALKEAAAAARHKGALAKLGSVEAALEAYRHAAALEPGDCWTWIEIARLERTAGRLAAAKEAALRAEAAAGATDDPHSAGAAANEIGDVLQAQGDLPAALDRYRDALAIRERLVAADPDNAPWQSNLAVSHDRIGDVLQDQGDLAAALDRYRDGLAIRERLVADDPGNAERRRDLAASHGRIGDVLKSQGDLPAALDRYRDALAIFERLVAADPDNAEWRRDLAVSHCQVGAVAETRGDAAAALLAYGEAEGLFRALVALDPTNARWRQDLAWLEARFAEVRSGVDGRAG